MKWKEELKSKSLAKKLLTKILNRKHKNSRSLNIKCWNSKSQTIKNLQSKEDLSTDFAAFTLKQSVFSEFKRICQLAVMKKQYYYWIEQQHAKKQQFKIIHELRRFSSLNKLKMHRISHWMSHWLNKDKSVSFDKWRNQVRKNKNLNNFENVLMNKDLNYIGKCVEVTWTAWKLFTCKNKCQKLAEELSIEKPKRQELQQDLSMTKRLVSIKSMMKTYRVLLRSSRANLSTYFTNWKNRTSNFKSGILRTAKLMTHITYKKIQLAFYNWKIFAQNEDIVTLCVKAENIRAENDTMVEHIANLEVVLHQKLDDKLEISKRVMKNALRIIEKKEMQSTLRKWAQNALFLANINQTGSLLENVLEKLFLGTAFVQIREVSKQIKNDMRRKRKLHGYFYKK